jgi:hypothetical protein
VRHTQRLAEAGAVTSVGSTGDSYDNALAEAFNSLIKAELVRNRGPWRSINDLEIAVAEYIDWFNHRRLHGRIDLIPPAEYEDNFYRTTPRQIRASTEPGAGHRPAEPEDGRQACARLAARHDQEVIPQAGRRTRAGRFTWYQAAVLGPPGWRVLSGGVR